MTGTEFGWWFGGVISVLGNLVLAELLLRLDLKYQALHKRLLAQARQTLNSQVIASHGQETKPNHRENDSSPHKSIAVPPNNGFSETFTPTP